MHCNAEWGLRRPETEATAPGRRDSVCHVCKCMWAAPCDTVPCWLSGRATTWRCHRQKVAQHLPGRPWASRGPTQKGLHPASRMQLCLGAAALRAYCRRDPPSNQRPPEKQLKPCTTNVSHPLQLHVVPVLFLLGLLLLQRGNFLVELINADAINVWRCCSLFLFACTILQALACTFPCREGL